MGAEAPRLYRIREGCPMMTWSEAYARAQRFATERGIRYAVFARKLNGRWIWYSTPVTGLAYYQHRALR
jgi:hypothetical protein